MHMKNDNINIRPINFERDSQELTSFLVPKDIERLNICRDAIQQGDVICLVADMGGQTVGVAIIHTKYRDDIGWDKPDRESIDYVNQSSAYFENIEIKRPLRNRGIGSKLLNAAEQETRSKGKDYLWLHTDERSIAAQRFYERHNWIHERTIHPEWKQGKPRRIYVKRLLEQDSNA